MGKKPLKATDKRRNAAIKARHGVAEVSETGEGKRASDLFNDRRSSLGHGKRAK